MSTLTKTLVAVFTAMLVGGAAYVAAATTGDSPPVTPAADVKGPCDEPEHATDPRCTGPQVPEDNNQNQAGDDNNPANDDQGEDVNDDNGVADDDQGEDVNDDNDVEHHGNRGPGSPNSGPGSQSSGSEDSGHSGPGDGSGSDDSGSGHSGSDDSGSGGSGPG